MLAHDLRIADTKTCTLRVGNLSIFSVERLLVFFTRIGCDIEIRVLPRQYVVHRDPRMRVTLREGTVTIRDCTERPAPGTSS